MKPCHICEKIVRIEKSVACIACKRVFCHLCIIKYFPQKASSLLAKRQNQALPNLKIIECFACLKQCECYKCKSLEHVVLTPINKTSPSQNIQDRLPLVNQQELVPETGLFRGKKISELPIHLQRIYLKKKVLYSKHEISCLSNDKNIPQQPNNDQGDEKMNPIQEEKEIKQDQQVALNNHQQAMEGVEALNKDKQKNDIDDGEEQAEDYESEFPSRRAAHIHNHNQNNSGLNEADVEDQIELEGQDPNNDNEQQRDEFMIDEKVEDQRKKRKRLVHLALQNRNDDSSIEQIAQ